MLPDHITKALHKIASEANFVDYDLDTRSGSEHGDNFGGSILAVTVTGTRTVDGRTNKDELHLICKLPPTNTNRQEIFSAKLAFEQEIFVYASILPSFLAFQREKGLSDAESFVSHPKAYACEVNGDSGDFVLIMDNLKAKKYEMWSKGRTIPLDHELLVMTELGKFHGISFAMKDQRPGEFAKLRQLTDILAIFMRGKMKPFMEMTFAQAAKALVKPEHKRLMEQFDYIEVHDRLFAWESCDKFGVIAHGDCWNNNFMFQYEDSEKTKVKAISLLDWQVARYCSPVLDLLYNIFTTTDKAFRDQHFETLLSTYYASLSGMVRRLGSDPEQLFSYANLQAELRRCGDFALLYGPMVVRVTSAKAENIRDVDELSDALANGENVDLLTSFDEETQAIYSKLVNEIVADLDDYGYLDHRK